MRGFIIAITGIVFSGCTSFGHLEKPSLPQKPLANEALNGVYTCMDSAWQQACSNNTSCTFLSRPFVFLPNGTVIGIGHIGFQQQDELNRYLAINREEIYNRYRMLGSYYFRGDTLIASINYPYRGRGQQGIYRPTNFSGIKTQGETIKDFKMVAPWPDIYDDAFYRKMNNGFSRLLTGFNLLYKGRPAADSTAP